MNCALTLRQYFTSARDTPGFPLLQELQIVSQKKLWSGITNGLLSNPDGYYKQQKEEARITNDQHKNWLEYTQGDKSDAAYFEECERLFRRSGYFHGLTVEGLKDVPELAEDLEEIRSLPEFCHLKF